MNRFFSMQPWVNVAVFEDFNAGQTLQTFLENKGFESRTFHDKLLQLFLFLCPPRATYRVQVRQNAFKSAIDFLAVAPDAPAILQKAIHCPACGSLRVQYPQMTRKFFLPTLLLHLGIIFRVVEHEAYCEYCHHIWNLSKEGALPARIPAPQKQFPLNEA
ncbi:MAG: hypothetical protein ACREFE_15465 [Limisphaerales bacterium]